MNEQFAILYDGVMSIVKANSARDIIVKQISRAARDIHVSGRYLRDLMSETYDAEPVLISPLYKDCVDCSDIRNMREVEGVIVDDVAAESTAFARLYSYNFSEKRYAYAQLGKTITILSDREFKDILVTYRTLPDVSPNYFNSWLIEVGLENLIVYLASSYTLAIIESPSSGYWLNRFNELLRSSKIQ